MRLVVWDNVCKPKMHGGLGMPSLYALQFAFNCSIIHRMYNCSSSLSSWFIMRYASPWRSTPSYASNFWKAICSTAVLTKNYFTFKVNPSSNISLHWDHWCDGTPLSSILGCNDLLHHFDKAASIKVILYGRFWNLPKNTPPSVANIIKNIPIHESSPISLFWDNSPNGVFANYLVKFYNDLPICSWHHIVWHKTFVLRFSLFAWLSLVGGLKTTDVLLHRNVQVLLLRGHFSVLLVPSTLYAWMPLSVSESQANISLSCKE
ncbi:hypothetical protein M5K25_018579 [Dendrobium thyrsiflorum]|uniref:Reverse transcriptase zinc-binding domain-containing protein n=1 Tax=Dendrobium thyrsiflorum TaxID=117978 RepID=A0ABD0UQL4_DENTH